METPDKVASTLRGDGRIGEAQRRIAVFVDMWDSTHFKPHLVEEPEGEQDDAPDVVLEHNALMAKCFRHVVAEASPASNGMDPPADLVKLLGDGALFLFDEEMLEHAVVFAAYFVECLEKDHSHLRTAIGMAYGEVLDVPVEPPDSEKGRKGALFTQTVDVGGRAVDLAARLVQIAAANQILLSQELAALLEGGDDAVQELWQRCATGSSAIKTGDETVVSLPASEDEPRIICRVQQLLLHDGAPEIRNQRVLRTQLTELLDLVTTALLGDWQMSLKTLGREIDDALSGDVRRIGDVAYREVKKVIEKFTEKSWPRLLADAILEREELKRVPRIAVFATTVNRVLADMREYVGPSAKDELIWHGAEGRNEWRKSLSSNFISPLQDQVDALHLYLHGLVEGSRSPDDPALAPDVATVAS